MHYIHTLFAHLSIVRDLFVDLRRLPESVAVFASFAAGSPRIAPARLLPLLRAHLRGHMVAAVARRAAVDATIIDAEPRFRRCTRTATAEPFISRRNYVAVIDFDGRCCTPSTTCTSRVLGRSQLAERQLPIAKNSLKI